MVGILQEDQILQYFSPISGSLRQRKTHEEETQIQIPRYLVSQCDLSSSSAVHVLTGIHAKNKIKRTTLLTNQLYVKQILWDIAYDFIKCFHIQKQ